VSSGVRQVCDRSSHLAILLVAVSLAWVWLVGGGIVGMGVAVGCAVDVGGGIVGMVVAVGCTVDVGTGVWVAIGVIVGGTMGVPVKVAVTSGVELSVVVAEGVETAAVGDGVGRIGGRFCPLPYFGS